MRYLNKIIFINSAHIRYAEIALDGNVHFTGTQGTGKSTLLRALLFFYNADKTHLGIKQGQQSFDQFYFEHANSYILYEVQREIGAYTILVARSQGSASFRFIDAPFDKSWIINDAGEVLSEWTKIRHNITKDTPVDISPLVNCSTYRDIIFGNHHERGNRFAKYALIESAKYQNIPRSIQNVFLNSKLDAEFVKKTIIESMSDSDSEEAIKLNVYRDQLIRFERLYEDIELWYRKDKAGDIMVLRLAQQVIRIYRELLAYEHQVKRAVHELNYAVKQTRENLPIAQEKLQELDENINTEKRHKINTETYFQKEKSTLDQKLGVQNSKLKDIREKRKYYTQQGIEEMLRQHESLPTLKSNKDQQQAILDALTRQFADIETKYKLLLGTLDNKFQEFKNMQSERLNYVRNEVQQKRDKLEYERREQLDAAEKRYYESCTEIKLRLEGLQTDQKNLELKMQELHRWQPYEKEKNAIQNELHRLDIEKTEVEAQVKVKEQETAFLRSEAQRDEENQIALIKRQEESLQAELKQQEEEYNHVNSILANYEGSLYEWLVQSQISWEDSIGKVVDEEKVLYAQGLSPVLTSSDQSTLFGIQLDLSQIKPNHRSPDDYQKQAQALHKQIENTKRSIHDLVSKKESTTKKINDKLSDKLKPILQELTSYKVRLQQIPQICKNKRTELATLERKENEIRSGAIEEKQKEYDEIVIRCSQTKEELNTKRVVWDKDKKRINEIVEAKKRDLRKPLEDLIESQKKELQVEENLYTTTKLKYEEECEVELKGEGADTTAINQKKAIIQQLDKEISRIEKQRQIVYAYLKDKEELFDREDAFKQEKTTIETNLQNLQNLHEEKVRRIDTRLAEMHEQRKKQDESIKIWQEGLKQYKDEVEIAHLIPEEYLYDEKLSQTTKSCQQVLLELRGILNEKAEKLKELKSKIRVFNNQFTPDNIFHFNINPYEDVDYFNIAVSLTEFVEKNKIEEYRTRTSEHYDSILKSVSREVGKLLAHQSEIEKIIREINKDFVENNFAGVIKSIELRSEQSDNAIMRLLYMIKEFTDENQYNLGTTNLFSTENNVEIHKKVISYLKRFMQLLKKESGKQQLTLSDTFNLQFRIKENDQDTGWVERINNVGSDGTDILVKAMINIMLINVFKKKASRNKNQDIIIHCMLDEIGKLHSNNVRGILHFASMRNIYLVNSSPESLNAYDYKYTYMLEKDAKSMTRITRLLKII